jgi:hypothetical protein
MSSAMGIGLLGIGLLGIAVGIACKLGSQSLFANCAHVPLLASVLDIYTLGLAAGKTSIPSA